MGMIVRTVAMGSRVTYYQLRANIPLLYAVPVTMQKLGAMVTAPKN